MKPHAGSVDIGIELVRRAQAGDRESLRALAERAYPRVRRWALARTGDPAEADDLTQDVLVQVIRKLGSFRGTARFSTWLYTVTRNVAMDRQRKRQRQERPEEDSEAAKTLQSSPAEDPAEAASRGQIGEILRGLFLELPDRQREVFELSDLEGYTSPEIAEMLGIEPVSVRASLFKARRTLRQWILDRHPDLAEDMG